MSDASFTVPLFRAHPWHGVEMGQDAPEIVNAYIEMLPTDTVKYELDKDSGLLRVDRPQKFSSMPPIVAPMSQPLMPSMKLIESEPMPPSIVAST